MNNINFDDDNFFSHFGEIMGEAMEQRLENSPYFIGMMSGTSLDGLDAVLCQFYDTGEIEILDSISTPFPDDLRDALLALSTPNGVDEFIHANQLAFVSELDVFGWASVFYAEFASGVIHALLNQALLTPSDINAIGCHGQTVRHRPHWHFSLQLLDPNVLAERTGISVVSDFRRRDMAVGGQGAPLVPAFHEAIFGKQSIGAVLNLGGIANLTILGETVLGFDTGSANLLMDAWCERHTGARFDKNGAWARSGSVIAPLLNQLLTHSFFAKDLPKSTGREEFNLAWLDAQLEIFNRQFNQTVQAADIQATLAELVAVSVAKHLHPFAVKKTLVVCGGGALNDYLMARLQANLTDWQINSSQAFGILPTLVESMAFAWLARQTIIGETGNLPAVTGANKKVVLGTVCFA
ncbi:anhydro-N-acetylmuramic acid kinase [Moraxella macacae 0408225]|uniref:Anhydro-N-acetylmuramic acid kinase n=1 Tax=Moraxella macacae 0408225 TaxID=1230338 RepID=L2F9D1_9GAMM|nr:anhydro-N-acetylmuramic acid kinase [Moraxella macacae]ELA09520.1 anhydro-N-acetylmuramic acid kinase [Moraxella macacae 0408225]